MQRLSFQDEIAKNKRNSILLIISAAAVIVGLVYFFAYIFAPSYLLFILPFSVIFILIYIYGDYMYGDSIVLAATHAKPAEGREHQYLRDTVEGLSIAAGIPQPKIYVMQSDEINAFATGRDEFHASVCVTTGLLKLLSREETQGVVAHEIAHVRNQDILLMTLVTILLGGIAILSDWAQRSFSGSRSRRGAGGKSAMLVIPALLLILFAPLISRLLAMAVSRQREYLADATGVEYTRNPVGLAKALEKIRDAAMPFSRASRGTAHLFFVNPLWRRVNEREGRLADLMSTHPPIARRILLLYQMGGIAGRIKG